MKKLLNRMKSVYQIPQKIKGLTDHREKSLIPHHHVVMAVLVLLMLQYESFHTVFSAPESMEKRLKHIIKGRIPIALLGDIPLLHFPLTPYSYFLYVFLGSIIFLVGLQ